MAEPVATTDAEQALHKWMTEQRGLTDLVGERIASFSSPMDDRKAARVNYQEVGCETVWSLKGETGQKVATLHVRCWGPTPAVTKQITNEIRGNRDNPRLSGYQGLLGGLIQVHVARVVDQAQDGTEPQEGEGDPEHMRLLVVTLAYSDPA